MTPLQFFLVGLGRDWYGAYSIVIPVYAFLFIPANIAMAGDYKRFLERTAKIQAGLLICVYCLSYAPALLTLPKFTRRPPRTPPPAPGCCSSSSSSRSSATPCSMPGHKSPAGTSSCRRSIRAKTWEGLLGGTASVTLIGAALWWATPFPGASWWMAAGMSAVIALMGFAGGLTLSAIKRDRGVKDYGTLVEGHGGVLGPHRLDLLRRPRLLPPHPLLVDEPLRRKGEGGGRKGEVSRRR